MSTKANAMVLAATVLWSVSGLAMDIAVSGFKPIYPEQEYSVWRTQLTMPVVDSLQPTLRWAPFPGLHQFGAGDSGKPFIPQVDAERARHVRYDVRIWQVENLTPRAVVYERFALETNSHTLEEPLRPSAPYFWSIRARFEIDGETRLSEWSMSMIPWTTRTEARKTGQIPATNFYRFETPSAGQARQFTMAPTEKTSPDKAVSSQVSIQRPIEEESGGVTRLTSDELRKVLVGNTSVGSYTLDGQRVRSWSYFKQNGQIRAMDERYGRYRASWEIRAGGCLYLDYSDDKYDGCYYYSRETANVYPMERPWSDELGYQEVLEGDPKNLDRGY